MNVVLISEAKFVIVLNQDLMKSSRENGSKSPRVPNLCTRWS
jgi:hypothetical protein